ncbi:MAG: hypothetical protein NTX17_07960 [Candidatus Eisenbacteria bacterium]|nr:hypothetical protein [Candidatus Eisenbacteria bacterium]
MLTYQPASPEQAEEFLQLLRIDAADYLERTAQLMQMTWSQFAELVKTVGRVCGVYQDGALVGFYWIEERGKVVH